MTDPVGLVTSVRYDERVLKAAEIVDPNGNRTRYAYSPAGLLLRVVAQGRPGEPGGDTDERPGTEHRYDFSAFDRDAAPIAARTIKRVEHGGARTVESVEYSDGLGRVVQVRTQAEDVTFGDPLFGAGDDDRVEGDRRLVHVTRP